MPEWLLIAVGILIGLVLIAGSVWWAFLGEFKPSRLLRQIEQSDNNWWASGGESGSGHHGGDAGSHSGTV